MVHFKTYLLPTLFTVAFCLFTTVLVKHKGPKLHVPQPVRQTPNIISESTRRRRPAVTNVVTLRNNKSARAASNFAGHGRDTVFILGYHRTGSSFTGAVLSSYPGAFYVFEPLHHFEALKKCKTVTFFNGSETNLTSSLLQHLRLELLQAWASCKLANLPRELLRPYLGDNLAQFVECRQSRANHSDIECRNILQNMCESSPLRVVKFIKLRMSDIEDLFESFPHLKIIHLVRDPRGNALSQRGKVHGESLYNISVDYCETVRTDSKRKERLAIRFPGRINTLLYENLAEFTLKETNRLLKFINKTFHLRPKMKQYIRRITKTTEKNAEPIVLRGEIVHL